MWDEPIRERWNKEEREDVEEEEKEEGGKLSIFHITHG